MKAEIQTNCYLFSIFLPYESIPSFQSSFLTAVYTNVWASLYPLADQFHCVLEAIGWSKIIHGLSHSLASS